jgi:hypothetical protein
MKENGVSHPYIILSSKITEVLVKTVLLDIRISLCCKIITCLVIYYIIKNVAYIPPNTSLLYNTPHRKERMSSGKIFVDILKCFKLNAVNV